MDNLPEDPPKDIDPYSTLNLTSSASAAEIRTAYKKLALKYHPGTYSDPLELMPRLLANMTVAQTRSHPPRNQPLTPPSKTSPSPTLSSPPHVVAPVTTPPAQRPKPSPQTTMASTGSPSSVTNFPSSPSTHSMSSPPPTKIQSKKNEMSWPLTQNIRGR